MTFTNEQRLLLYKAYLPDMRERIIEEYEHRRNRELPPECAPYQVDRKRYKDDFWNNVLIEHLHYGYCPIDTIAFARSVTGGRMPWPELIKRIPEILTQTPRLESRFERITNNTYNLVSFKPCRNRKELDETIEKFRSTKPEALTAYPADYFAYLLSSPSGRQNLIHTPHSRLIATEALLNMCNPSLRTSMETVIGEHLVELTKELNPVTD
jgi:hypothetical protein